MKNLKLILLFIFLAGFFIFAKPVQADLIMPQPADNCQKDEEYFREDKINSEKYKNIRAVEFEDRFHNKKERGYCVNREEYCLKTKNFCNLKIMLRATNSPLLHIKNLIINFLFNNLFLVLMLTISSQNIKRILQKITILKMGIITLIGYFWDFIFVFHIGPFLMGKYLNLFHFPWYIHTMITGKTRLDLELASTSISFTLIFIFTTLSFYFIIGKKIFRKKKFLKSILFGILSNPVWFSSLIFVKSIWGIMAIVVNRLFSKYPYLEYLLKLK